MIPKITKGHNNPPELYDGVQFTRGPMYINHFYEISKHGVNALRLYQFIRTIQGLRYPGKEENSHKWVKVDNRKLYEWFGVSQPKKWTLLDRLSNEKNPKFTKKILEVKKKWCRKITSSQNCFTKEAIKLT
jgi:hypothetical protein